MGVKISDLPASAAAARAMQFEVNNAGVSERLTLSQMFALSTGAVTTDSPVLNMGQTWASGGVTFSGWKLNVTDTASAADSKLLDLQVGGNPVFAIRKDGNFIWGSNAMVFCLGGFYEAYFGPGMVAIAGQVGLGETPFNADVMMHRDGPNTLALVNAANPQEFRLYNRFTDASNYERAGLSWTKVAGYLVLSTESAGTGAARPLWLNSAQDLYFTAGGAGSAQWKLTQSGHLHANTDDAYDIGANGANRPRNIYAAERISGQLQTHAAAVTETITPNKTLTLYDNTGTAYKVACVAA